MADNAQESVTKNAEAPGNDDAKEVDDVYVPIDPFDPEQVRLTVDRAYDSLFRKELLSLPIQRPDRESYVRTHPNPEYWMEKWLIELKEDGEYYLVDPSLHESLESESTYGKQLLITSVNREKISFLWPVRLKPNGQPRDIWASTALEAAKKADEKWTRVAAGPTKSAGYEVILAPSQHPEPTFVEASPRKLIEVAFQNSYIDSPDHPVLKRLRGED